jgi:hypothetical protein
MSRWNVIVSVTREYEYQVEAATKEDAEEEASSLASIPDMPPSDFIVTYEPEIVQSWELGGEPEYVEMDDEFYPEKPEADE